MKTVFVSLSHALALGSFVYVIIMGTLNFTGLTSTHVSYFQVILVYSAPLLAVKIGDIITAVKSGGTQ
jgi:hypothetical protein